MSNNFTNRDKYGIKENDFTIFQFKHVREIFKTNPWRIPDTKTNFKVLKRDCNAEHRDQMENNEKHNTRQEHQVIVFVK
ncbi:hypothetical protein D3C84_1087310 [compost metagenome]